jgi:hypothetical protein
MLSPTHCRIWAHHQITPAYLEPNSRSMQKPIEEVLKERIELESLEGIAVLGL